MRTHITIIHKDFTLETLCKENQQTKEIYHSYYLSIVITTTISDCNSLSLQTNNT